MYYVQCLMRFIVIKAHLTNTLNLIHTKPVKIVIRYVCVHVRTCYVVHFLAYTSSQLGAKIKCIFLR